MTGALQPTGYLAVLGSVCLKRLRRVWRVPNDSLNGGGLLIVVQHLMHKHSKPREVNRFRQTCHQSETRGLVFRAFHVPSAHHNNGNMRPGASQLFDKLESVNARHEDIHDKGVVVSRMRQYQSGRGRIGDVHLYTLTSKGKSQAIGQRR